MTSTGTKAPLKGSKAKELAGSSWLHTAWGLPTARDPTAPPTPSPCSLAALRPAVSDLRAWQTSGLWRRCSSLLELLPLPQRVSPQRSLCELFTDTYKGFVTQAAPPYPRWREAQGLAVKGSPCQLPAYCLTQNAGTCSLNE